jgi:hypothetical protein
MFSWRHHALACLNFTDLIISLFRGTLDCEKPDSKESWSWAVLQGTIWKAHGESVAAATPYLPGSFDRPPRNPAEKLTSGYKAWEFLLYIIGLAPALLHGILPDAEWRHLCKGVCVIHCFNQQKIPMEQLVKCHKLAIEYVAEFETLYFQGMPERIHFVRQSVHHMTHLGPEAIRLGPAALYSQWTIERTIGNLGQEIKSHSQPYANLAERALCRAQVNVLKAMIPDLDPEQAKTVRCSIDLGHGYTLLHARESTPVRQTRSANNPKFFDIPERSYERGLVGCALGPSATSQWPDCSLHMEGDSAAP